MRSHPLPEKGNLCKTTNAKPMSPKTTPSTFRSLCRFLSSEMKRLRIPGVALGVWHKGREYSAGFGVTSIENPLPVTPDTLFQVGSISKTFTGTLLMQLVDPAPGGVEQGRLDLDVPVCKYLPDLKLQDKGIARRVTTRHLLTHVGGWVGDYFNDFGNGDEALAQMVASIAQIEQITPLGAIWSYNNAGFNIAARVVEAVTGKPYEQAAQTMLFDPLGLKMTYFFPSDILITHRFVVGHHVSGKRVRVARPWAIGRAGAGVGGVVSTVKDLLVYARFHMGKGKRLMKRATLEAMRVPQVDAGGRGQMGLTWFIRQADGLTLYGHGGATKGQQAAFQFVPQEDFAIAVLTNSGNGGILSVNVVNRALEIFFGAHLPVPKPIHTPVDKLKEYAGRYDLPLSAFDLKLAKGRLVLHEIPRGGFPTPDSPPGPVSPPGRFAFYAPDRVIGLDEPWKGAFGEFFRDTQGRVQFFRLGGRAHRKIERRKK
jgi:CubicO group peptidase (beta-lactamase class C family)